MGKIHGRITKEDIRSAHLRKWSGRERITTDWANLYHEPELWFPSGDCLVYLREPGQSSRGPSFRIHTSQLLVKGFRSLVDRTTARPSFHEPETCTIPACEGCNVSGMRELYLPAPPNCDLDSTIDYHVTTRNFFAWLYKIPLAGKALGVACVALKERIDKYRPTEAKNRLDVIAYLEFHRYLDFRECIDHALAAVYIAETMELEDLWVDAFAHCVGMSHLDMRASLEFPAVSKTTKAMIVKARLEMDIRLDRVSRSVMNFFESDLSGTFLGLHQAAREHFDRFRSFLHGFYIEQHGFWPPENFDDKTVKKNLYATMYTDFRNLYHHLVDVESTPKMALNISASGGVCTLQNVQAFNQRHGYEALPHSIPMLPVPSSTESTQTKPRRTSMNPLRKNKANRDVRIELEMQALIDSSNRDWNIMSSLLVRRYSKFEQQSVFDLFENVSVLDGRKVRWILIYAVLQTLISVMQAPTQVRNTEGLSYSLCCHAPQVMPWKLGGSDSPCTSKASAETDRNKVELEPDNNYSHTNSSSSSLSKERRNSTPLTGTKAGSDDRTLTEKPRPSSLRRILTRRSTSSTIKTTSSSKKPAYCEIFVQGYGNGLNEVTIECSTKDTNRDETINVDPITASHDPDRSLTPSSDSAGVSRESSSASGYSSKSMASDSTGTMPDMDHLSVVNSGESVAKNGDQEVKDEKNVVGQIHFNTETWDHILRQA